MTDAAPAISTAIQQAAGRIVWIPAGTYRVDSRIIVNNVTIRGAGIWHTVLNFTSTGDNTGFHGNNQPNPSANVHISNLRMNGNIQERNDGAQTNAFGQGFTNSSFTNVWAEHFKVGAWLFGPATNVVFTGVRFRNTNADGINFNGGFTNSLVTQSHFRNNGDDGLAMWSIQVNQNNSFTFNTVETTLLANGIAIYGGANNSVTDNRVIDTGLNQGGGIHVGNRFGAPALSGTTTIARNTLIRTGNLDTNWQFGVGSIWFDARDGAMNGTINVTNLLIQQAPYSAIMFVSGSSITNVNFNDVTVQGVGTYVLQLQVNGSASFQNVVASNIGRAGIWNCLGAGQFNVINNGGNDTWINSPLCQGTAPDAGLPAAGGRPRGYSHGPGLRFAGGEHEQRRAHGQCLQYRVERRADQLDRGHRRFLANQQLRHERAGEWLVHGERGVQADGCGYPHRLAEHQQQRGQCRGRAQRHRHVAGRVHLRGSDESDIHEPRGGQHQRGAGRHADQHGHAPGRHRLDSRQRRLRPD